MKECVVMNRQELKDMQEKFSLVYDIVRLVEPESASVVILEENQYKRIRKESCFSVWEKEKRCENCISLCACIEKKRMTKFEFRENETYSVISMPILVKDQEEEHLLAMELVNKVSDDIKFYAHGTGEFIDEIKKINNKIYEDSLTGVYNRRYYDEHLHITELMQAIPKKIGYLVIDINRFKYVNDTFGHAHGDELLALVAEVLKKNTRETDRVVRIGGDEFLVVLRDCSEILLKKKIKQLKREVSKIKKEWMQEYIPSVAIGMAYTDKFNGSSYIIKKLFEEADARMYENKALIANEKRKMLLVDDLSINIELLKMSFEDEFEIYEAKDGYEALEIMQTEIIEIVITDIYMPKMDGLELTRKIRAIPELETVIIFVVTERGEEFELEALKAGADDFINKPFDPELLNHRIRGVLAQNTVVNRISQYQLSFNQNQFAFATVKIKNGRILYEYVNDAFIQLLGGTPDDFIFGRKKLEFEGFVSFLIETNETQKRNKMTVYDNNQHMYYDIIAYSQGDDFVSFIVMRNDEIKLMKRVENHYVVEFENLITVNPNTFGALFINLESGVCEKGFGRSDFFKEFESPCDYSSVVEKLSIFPVTKEDKEAFLEFCSSENLLREYQEGKKSFSMELPVRLLNGAVHWVGVYIQLTKNLETEELEEVLYSVDIHERRLSQLVIDNVAKGNFDTLFCIDVGADTAQVYLGDGNVYWSQPFPCARIDQDIKKYLELYYREPDKEQFIQDNAISVIAKKMKDMDYYSVQYYLMEDDGKRHLKKGNYYWLDPSKSLLCFTREDITDVVQKEQEVNQKLQSINKELEKASKAKGDFLSNMSHEIRTPMNAIIGMTKLAEMEVKKGSQLEQYIKEIDNSSEYLLGVINDILDMSRIESGKMQLHEQWISPKAVIVSCIDMIQPLMREKELIFEYPEGLRQEPSFEYLTDVQKMKQMLMNILNNAYKFTPRGGHVRIRIENIALDEKACIATDRTIIEDDGCGMSKEFMKKVFTLFEQERNDVTKAVQGTGLGLALARNIARIMGGDIKVESQLGKGSKFMISYTYRYRLLSEKTESTQKKETKTESVLVGKQVLLAEDHPLNALIAKKILEKYGIMVETVNDGEEAVRAFMMNDIGTYDAILMDIRMPHMNGLEAAARIRSMKREDARSIPIIAMTANAFDEDIQKSKDAGMNAHLSKPIEPQLLYEELQRQIEG